VSLAVGSGGLGGPAASGGAGGLASGGAGECSSDGEIGCGGNSGSGGMPFVSVFSLM